MKQKIDVIFLVGEFNKCRMNNLKKTFSSEKLKNILRSLGFNRMVTDKLLSTHFDTVKVGTRKIYYFRNDPLHKAALQKIYDDIRKYQHDYYESNKESSVDKAISLLKEQGYELRKIAKFDETRFAQEHPELYKQYLIYEEI